MGAATMTSSTKVMTASHDETSPYRPERRVRQSLAGAQALPAQERACRGWRLRGGGREVGAVAESEQKDGPRVRREAGDHRRFGQDTVFNPARMTSEGARRGGSGRRQRSYTGHRVRTLRSSPRRTNHRRCPPRTHRCTGASRCRQPRPHTVPSTRKSARP
jgi:hypothetical protein